jgi:hypothetical protein
VKPDTGRNGFACDRFAILGLRRKTLAAAPCRSAKPAFPDYDHLKLINAGVASMDIVRRLGSTPRERGSISNGTCPDIFEVSDGSFAVIGRDVTEELRGVLPPDAGVASYERIVLISRKTLLDAGPDIPLT